MIQKQNCAKILFIFEPTNKFAPRKQNFNKKVDLPALKRSPPPAHWQFLFMQNKLFYLPSTLSVSSSIPTLRLRAAFAVFEPKLYRKLRFTERLS
jgi:hypothetical protein